MFRKKLDGVRAAAPGDAIRDTRFDTFDVD